MIETTVKVARGIDVLTAIHKLKVCRTFEPGYGYQIGCVIRDFETEFNKLEAEVTKGYEEIAEKDESGKPKFEVSVDNKTGLQYGRYFFTPENQKAADEIGKSSGENKLVIQSRPKLYLSKLLGAGLTPMELIAIDFMIDENK